MKKSLIVTFLTVASFSIASAKTYEIVLSNVTKAGSVQLKPGQYKVKVQGSNAIFTDVTSSKSFTTPVKVENAEKKFETTRVQTTKDGEADKLQEIDLGGSSTKLDF